MAWIVRAGIKARTEHWQGVAMDEPDKPEAPQPGALHDAGADSFPGPPEAEPTCAICGGRIGLDDVVCPHCGESLVAG